MSERFYNLDRQKTVLAEGRDLSISMSVVIVSYNSRELLRDCLASLESEPWERVMVVDNLSSDGSAEMVRQDFPWVKLIISNTNNGYGAAANLAAAGCSSKYVLILNSDTVIQPGALHALADYLDQHPEVAVAGPRLVNPDGTDQISCFEYPTPFQTLLRETSLSRFVPASSRVSSNELPNRWAPHARQVPWVLGAALAIRQAAFESVNGFDESYFMYFEEVDLCYRLNQAGWEIHLAPEAVITHVGGASTRRHRAAMLQQLYKSLCHFYHRHYSGRQKIQLRFILTYLMFRNIFKDGYRACRANGNDEPVDNLSVWRSILTSVWASGGWLRD